MLGRRCVELLGHGDVMRPWSWDEEGSHVQAEVGWQVLEPTRLAVLDHGLVVRIVPWPQLGVELFNRGTRRAHHLAVALAIAHHQRVEDRLLLTLWHLAERWGRVHPDGIVLPLPLGHQRLADLVGAHRPTVTTALGDLARAGTVSRRDERRLGAARLAARAAAPPPAGGRPQLTATGCTSRIRCDSTDPAGAGNGASPGLAQGRDDARETSLQANPDGKYGEVRVPDPGGHIRDVCHPSDLAVDRDPQQRDQPVLCRRRTARCGLA